MFVSGLLACLAVCMAQVRLRAVLICRHGSSTRHTGVGHRGHTGCLRHKSRTDVACHCMNSMLISKNNAEIRRKRRFLDTG